MLQNLKLYKASGPDKIPTHLLKECTKEIVPSLVLLFRASLKQSIVPTEWKHAFVTPMFKKGDHSLASNYRSVSLTSVCGKLLEHIVHSEVMNHLNLHDILSNAQHGFRSKRSCETQLLLTVHDFASGLNEKWIQLFLTLLKLSTKSRTNIYVLNYTTMVYMVQYLIGLKTSSQIGLNK